MKRRDFVKKAGIAGAAYAGIDLFGYAMPMTVEAIGTSGGIDIPEGLYILEEGKEKNIIPEIRPEILNNPRAVFLIETHVEVRRDETGMFTEARPQMFEIGKRVTSQLFVKGSKKGGSTLILPNFTNVNTTELQNNPSVGIMQFL